MLIERSFSFDQLTIDKDYIYSMLGFADGILPEPFNDYVAEAFEKAESICDIKGAFCFPREAVFSSDSSHIVVDGQEFGIGKTLAKELRNSSSVAFFICTAGEGLSQLSTALLHGDNPVLGYIYDLMGSLIVESAADLMQKEIRQMAISRGLAITNRYSPGYCKWSVADQHKLFSFFPEGCCGINLTESALMSPVKSVSGIIGIGENVRYRDYTCDLCSMTDCFHRNYHRQALNTIKEV